MTDPISSPITQALEDSVNFFRQKETIATCNVRKEQMEFEQKLIADVAVSPSMTYDKTGTVTLSSSSTITIRM